MIAANVPPALNIALQRVEIGETFSYRIQDSDMSGIASGESVTITMSSNGGSGVQLLNNNTFSRSTAFSQLASYTLAGTISDGKATSNWSFTLSVVDTRAPQLRIADQSIDERQPFSYTINEGQDISNLRSGETYTVDIMNDGGTGVTYTPSSKTFSGNPSSLAPGTYTLQGILTDASHNQSSWSFRLTVKDVTAPRLHIADQTLPFKRSFSYTINKDQDISGLSPGEDYTIRLIDDGGSSVVYNETSKTFHGNTSSLSVGDYRLRGTITSATHTEQWSDWFFTLKIRDTVAPKLTIPPQTINKAIEDQFSYTIDEAVDISDLETGETYEILITDTGGIPLSYYENGGNRTFSTSSYNLPVGTHTIRGKIVDENNSFSDWSFTLTVQDFIPDNTPPRVTYLSKEVSTWSWECSESPCTYRYAFSSTTSDNFDDSLFTMPYGTDSSVDEPGNGSAYYIYVQAKDGANNESQVVWASHDQAGEPPVLKVRASESHTCAILGTGNLKCWGQNHKGQLGNGKKTHWETPVRAKFTTDSIEDVAPGNSYTCVLLKSGSIKCWGHNAEGQLGQNHTEDVYLGDETNESGTTNDNLGDQLPTIDLGTNNRVRSIATGPFHVCALIEGGAGAVKCWGLNDYGQLGYNHTRTLGDGLNENLQEVDEMGKSLLFVDLGLEPGVSVVAIAAGYSHTCALFSEGSVKCWGDNSGGKLGYDHTRTLGDGLNENGDAANEMGEELPTIDLGLEPGVSAVAIAAGYSHTCALLSEGSVKCWGDNSKGQLGQGTNFSNINLGTNLTAKSISVGILHTCATLSNDKVKCWGSNWQGQLGYDHTQTLGDGLDQDRREVDEMGDNLPFLDLGTNRTVKTVVAGSLHTCAILDNDRVKCWGNNSHGQLGYDHIYNLGDGVDINFRKTVEMGDNLPFIQFEGAFSIE